MCVEKIHVCACALLEYYYIYNINIWNICMQRLVWHSRVCTFNEYVIASSNLYNKSQYIYCHPLVSNRFCAVAVQTARCVYPIIIMKLITTNTWWWCMQCSGLMWVNAIYTVHIKCYISNKQAWDNASPTDTRITR